MFILFGVIDASLLVVSLSCSLVVSHNIGSFFFFQLANQTMAVIVAAPPTMYAIVSFILNPSGAMQMYVVTTQVMNKAGTKVTK